MKQKTVKVHITAPFWFKLWIAISFLFTGVFEWEEKSFYEELIKEMTKVRKISKSKAVIKK